MELYLPREIIWRFRLDTDEDVLKFYRTFDPVFRKININDLFSYFKELRWIGEYAIRRNVFNTKKYDLDSYLEFRNKKVADITKKELQLNGNTILKTTENYSIHYTKSIPVNPGVYFFYDKNNVLLYVGSSKMLRNRIPSSYRERTTLENPVVKIAYSILDTEYLARRVEAEMIRTLHPLLNTDIPDFKDEFSMDDIAMDLMANEVNIWHNLNDTKFWGEH